MQNFYSWRINQFLFFVTFTSLVSVVAVPPILIHCLPRLIELVVRLGHVMSRLNRLRVHVKFGIRVVHVLVSIFHNLPSDFIPWVKLAYVLGHPQRWLSHAWFVPIAKLMVLHGQSRASILVWGNPWRGYNVTFQIIAEFFTTALFIVTPYFFVPKLAVV